MHCLESARLLSERRDHPLPRGKRIGLRLHLLICSLCRAYQKQIEALCGIAHEAGASPSSHGAYLPPDRKQAIQDAIDRG
jgi:predicted anti-sigma-YlaC factor YlaD